MKTLSFDTLETTVGEELGVSDWVTIDQARINQFADATGDHQWIHVDAEKAKAVFGSTIAHGFLTLSLLPMLSAEIFNVDGVSRVINYGCNKVRFPNMVPVGSKVRLRQNVASVEAKAGGKQMTCGGAIEIEGQEKPACIVESVMVFYA